MATKTKEKHTLKNMVVYDPKSKKFIQKDHLVHGEKVISGVIISCLNCGKEFPKKRVAQKFCSRECRMNWWMKQNHDGKNPDYGKINCAICGKEFQRTRPWSKYCSEQCRAKSRISKPAEAH